VEAEQIVALAIGAAGASEDVIRWKGRVNGLIPQVAAMFNEKSPQMKQANNVLNASVFMAEYVSHALEESSQRIMVTIKAEPSTDYPDGLEPIRTEMLYNAIGKRQAKALEEFEPGDSILIWRYMDEVKSKKGRAVRTLAHFERLSFKTSGASPTPRGRTGSASGSPGNPPSPAEPAGPNRAIAALNGLDTAAKIRAVARFKTEGIAQFAHPPAEQLDRVLAIIAEEKAR